MDTTEFIEQMKNELPEVMADHIRTHADFAASAAAEKHETETLLALLAAAKEAFPEVPLEGIKLAF